MRRPRTQPFLLSPNDPSGAFPRVDQALRDPDGLLAIGGDLSVRRLINAYRHGIFPWYNQGDPILWWSPDPRTLLFPEHLHISRSLRKALRKRRFCLTMDRDFPQVINTCASINRHGEYGTWLLPEMIRAYRALNIRGIAHSVEVWEQDQLVGGLYGVAVGRAFFGESMFSRATNASKIALVYLCQRLAQWGFGFIDCQVVTEHLLSMGARPVARAQFIELLEGCRDQPGRETSWDDGGFHDPELPTDEEQPSS
ncbi:leucyl/phenylalanyl-tRNA--protein transferase [Rhabdochromatium marinum]|uniref:leucyl/phenylalanyl-tRNA--protein transferase n=1 Tax=Rhabdochromatium marinum TaxID=48729 RepID=UPI001904202E|nr:leucyl/phenylalanyl-tRNA--protein transferase [Rhabdochromatium marinum]MBK1648139.1 leucyl/phenylalanyl-tRNA--protein transferase [Rhabdochromatium marinum]